MQKVCALAHHNCWTYKKEGIFIYLAVWTRITDFLLPNHSLEISVYTLHSAGSDALKRRMLAKRITQGDWVKIQGQIWIRSWGGIDCF